MTNGAGHHDQKKRSKRRLRAREKQLAAPTETIRLIEPGKSKRPVELVGAKLLERLADAGVLSRIG